jgi:hypothetical protein
MIDKYYKVFMAVILHEQSDLSKCSELKGIKSHLNILPICLWMGVSTCDIKLEQKFNYQT